MTTSRDKGEEFVSLAKQLDKMKFSEVTKIVEHIKDGIYTVLPHLTRVYSCNENINPSTLSKCARAQTLVVPNCRNLNDHTLIMMPYIKTLIINARCGISCDVFMMLSRLERLEIISNNVDEVDILVNKISVDYLTNLRFLYLFSRIITDDDIIKLKQLRILVVTAPMVTSSILSYLPHMELCIINNVIHRYVDNIYNRKIVKKLSKTNEIRI
jgi:hypothetical protein